MEVDAGAAGERTPSGLSPRVGLGFSRVLGAEFLGFHSGALEFCAEMT